MAANEYHFITRWVLDASCEEVYELLEDAETLSAWWPAVYLDVKILEKGKPGGIGKVVELFTKGWLPYTLRWKFIVTESNRPKGFSLEAFGDFVGTGVWKFDQLNGTQCEVIYDWKINAEKPILKTRYKILREVAEGGGGE